MALEKRNIHFFGPRENLPLVEAVSQVAAADDPARARWLVEFGAVYVNHVRTTDAQRLISTSDLIRVHLNPKRFPFDRDEIRRRVVGETDNFLVINKPSGLPMHPTLDNLHENLLRSFDEPVYVTHRLDVPTSGLVVIAKSKEYQTLFNHVVATRALQKKYEAITEKPVTPGFYRHFMRPSEKAPKEIADHPPAGERSWKECELRILKGEPVRGRFYLHEIELLTGRTHQIRAQLAHLGSPIVGDDLYGGCGSEFFGLHASEIAFTCPKTSKSVHFLQSSFSCAT